MISGSTSLWSWWSFWESHKCKGHSSNKKNWSLKNSRSLPKWLSKLESKPSKRKSKRKISHKLWEIWDSELKDRSQTFPLCTNSIDLKIWILFHRSLGVQVKCRPSAKIVCSRMFWITPRYLPTLDTPFIGYVSQGVHVPVKPLHLQLWLKLWCKEASKCL